MKVKLYSFAALLAVASLVSCAGSDNNNYVDKSIIPTAEEKAATEKAAAEKAASNANMTNQNMMPVNATPGQTTAPITMPQQAQTMPVNTQMVQQVAPTVTLPGMNPPHGQPNHRCDIAVGAPLNSKPATPTTVTAQQPQVTMKEIPNTQKTAPGMNPPHGQPGHRCDIAVGAPLNSKPAAAPVTIQTPVQATNPPPLIAAPKTDSTKN